MVSCSILLAVALVRSEVRAQRQSSVDIYRQNGELLNPNHPYPNPENIVMRAKDFTISNRKFQQDVESFMLSGYSREEATQKTKELLAEKYAMYHDALKHGFQGRRDVVLAGMEQTKADIETASNGEDYEAFLEGIGMTSEEYWESQMDSMMMYDAIYCYKESLKAEFVSTSVSPSATPEEAQQQWEAYYQTCVERAIADQEIEVLN